ncbi:MAG: rRNA maturation RNase YbeY [Telmatospirillum sp.]|nr:rRNA maturation RNase YbeY [Telmatospirillum sp.]
MTTADIAVTVTADAWTRACADAEEVCRRAALAALAGAGPDALPPQDQLEISVVLADDALVHDLNLRYRGIDKPTNVLSFATLDDEDDTQPEDGPLLLGDVILAFGITEAEAGAEGKTIADHMTHLVVHGVLHLLGFDHIEEDEALEMETAERTILAGLGIADPYADSPAA